jgi:hypothetical protein
MVFRPAPGRVDIVRAQPGLLQVTVDVAIILPSFCCGLCWREIGLKKHLLLRVAVVIPW